MAFTREWPTARGGMSDAQELQRQAALRKARRGDSVDLKLVCDEDDETIEGVGGFLRGEPIGVLIAAHGQWIINERRQRGLLFTAEVARIQGGTVDHPDRSAWLYVTRITKSELPGLGGQVTTQMQIGFPEEPL